MKKILFLIHDLGPGGAEKVLVNLVNNMDANKFDITLVALFGGGVNEALLNKGIKYRTIFPRSVRGNSHIMKMLSPRQLHKCFIKEKYDIEISYLEGSSARIVSGCPDSDTKLISWIHSLQHTKAVSSKAFRSYKESVECYSRFDRIVCVSESAKCDFMKLYPMIKCVDVLYNTNETGMIRSLMKEDIEDNVFQKQGFCLCGVGKIMPVKGFERFARVHKRLIDDGYSVYSYILGTGREQENIQKFLKENQLEDSFIFLGYQKNPYKYIAKCDLFVCSSYSEGFSTAATEALIVGTPVVTMPVGGMEEMLGNHNEFGVITQMTEDSLYQNIKELIENRQKLEYYRKQAIIRGDFFSKENTVRAVEQYLEALVDG